MTNFLSKYLTPSQMSKAYMVIGAAFIIVIAIVLMEVLAPEQQIKKAEANVDNLLTTKNAREFGLDAVNDKLTDLTEQYAQTKERVDVLIEENKTLKANSRQSIGLARELQTALQEIQKLKGQIASTSASTQAAVEEYVRGELGDLQQQPVSVSVPASTPASTALKVTPERRGIKNSQFSYGAPQGTRPLPTENNPDIDPNYQPSRGDKRTEILFSVIENQTPTSKNAEIEIYLPKGAILTGVLLTGLDAPTASSAQENPIPLLVRLKKEAILPNHHTLEEVRECFALMAGYGDLSSERAFIRGEAITCVKHDGEVLEKTFKGFAVGEDGKNGLKGTLVTRNSTVLANAMMAGFAAGLASMFDVNPVPVLATSSNGQQQYQDVFSSHALQGGAAKGASEAMTRLADYYMELADSMHPVIEIGGGRIIDFVITQGTTL